MCQALVGPRATCPRASGTPALPEGQGLTARGTRARIGGVIRILRIAALAAAFLLTAGLLMGQDKRPPEPETEEPEHRHNPQPAWKSVEIGDYYVIKKAYRAALSRYQEAMQVDPYYPQTYLGMGRVYDGLGLRQKALENYNKYLDLLPSAKDAEEAHEVHKAVARLERKLKAAPAPTRNHSSVVSTPSSD